MSSAICTYCGKPILWVKNEATGKMGPVDTRPTVCYQMTEGLQGLPMRDEKNNPIVRPVRVYLSHWITCPEREKAARDRDAKKKGAQKP